MGFRRDTVPAERWTADEELASHDLTAQLAERLKGIRPGNVMEVVTHAEYAPAAISDWCAKAGKRLIWSRPPKFWIEQTQ